MHLCIRRTPKYQPTDAVRTTLIFAVITDCREYAPLHRMTASAKNHLAHGKSSSKSLKNQAAKLSFTALFTLISGESHFKGTATVYRSLKDKGERR